MTLEFLLPIETVSHNIIDDSVIKDLEVVESKSTSEDTSTHSLFDAIYKPEHPVDELVKERIMSAYTTDIPFLTQTSKFIKVSRGRQNTVERDVLTRAYDAVKEISDEQDFHSKYQYIEIGLFKSLNHSPQFMQMLSFYNMLSPLITLLTPVIIMILPFFLIRYQGIPLSMKAYIGTIKHLLRNHAIGKLAESFGSISWEKRVYLMITVSFYVLQVYQNALSCYRFTRNMVHIHKQLFAIRAYIESTCSVIQETTQIVQSNNLDRYQTFSDTNGRCLIALRSLLSELECITPLRISIPKACQVGSVMRLYYSIRHDETIQSAIDYSFKLNSYLGLVKQLSETRCLKPATFTESSTQQWEAKNLKYPHHINRKTVGNTFKLKRPLLLTGPNASGKTTLLKSAFLNTLLSQQFGCGFYDKLILKPYDVFHCYLDIPDTSGRDSLFQAEARRCLDIIKSVDDNKKRYFCIFDELYSGTNPVEAVAGAFAFTRFLAKRRNVSFLITTHFYDFCKLCETHRVGVRNCQMEWDSRKDSNTSDDVTFTYKVKSGISTLRGGVRVLKQIGYPTMIVDDALTILKDYV